MTSSRFTSTITVRGPRKKSSTSKATCGRPSQDADTTVPRVPAGTRSRRKPPDVLDGDDGHDRVSCQQAEALFTAVCEGVTLHQLRHALARGLTLAVPM